MTTFVFVRHGESEANVLLHKNPHLLGKYDEQIDMLLAGCGKNPSLSERGNLQAVETAKRLCNSLRGGAIDNDVCILVSPLKRAQQTLQVFMAELSETFLRDAPKVEIVDEMQEYERTTHRDAQTFVCTVFVIFKKLHERALLHKTQTIILFGHSLVFNTLLHIIGTHSADLDEDAHLRLVLQRMCSVKDPRFLNTVFHLPNCSISVAQTKKKDESSVDWSILGVGKDDHLRTVNLATGGHSDF